jgi:hypothetical protein
MRRNTTVIKIGVDHNRPILVSGINWNNSIQIKSCVIKSNSKRIIVEPGFISFKASSDIFIEN